MFKRTAVPPVGPSEHQARQPLNMALGLSITKSKGWGNFRQIRWRVSLRLVDEPVGGSQFSTEAAQLRERFPGKPKRFMIGFAKSQSRGGNLTKSRGTVDWVGQELDGLASRFAHRVSCPGWCALGSLGSER